MELIQSIPGADRKASCREIRNPSPPPLDLVSHSQMEKHKRNAALFSNARTSFDTGTIYGNNTVNSSDSKALRGGF